MKIRARVEMYKGIFKECKALEPVSMALSKGYKSATPLQRLEITATGLSEVSILASRLEAQMATAYLP